MRPLKQIIRNSSIWQRCVQPIRSEQTVREWLRSDRAGPTPHCVKVRNLLTVADLARCDTFVETGTLAGDTIAAVEARFKAIVSIELDPGLARDAARRFRSRKHIQILQGDSAAVLPRVIGRFERRPILFWLDGHYSGAGTAHGGTPTPIVAELNAIFSQRPDAQDAIVIDDARCFGTEAGYPTLQELKRLIPNGRQWCFSATACDAIFILPARN